MISISGSSRHATTGIDGHFSIDSIERGVHDILLSHPFTDSIGLALGAKSVQFAAGQQTRAEFAVPSDRGLRMLFCGENGTAHNRTILTGRVARVDSNTPSGNTTVELDWIEIGFQSGKGIVNQTRHLSAMTNAEGRYVFCNLADGLDATIRAVSSVDSSGHLTVAVGDKAVGIQYLFLPPASTAAVSTASTPPRTAVVRGLVADAAGHPLDAATVDVIRGEMSTTTGADGGFNLARAPMGSQLLRVRRLGYEELIQPITVSSTKPNQFSVELSKTVAALDPVVIRARLSGAAVRSGFEKRALTGPGRYFTGEFLQAHRTRCVFDVIRIDGFTLRRGSSICSAGIVPRNRGYATIPNSIAEVGTGLDQCAQLLVDDLEEFPGSDAEGFSTWQLGWLDPKSIVGIEVYSRGTAPMNFPHSMNCAVILIWTSRYYGKSF